MRIQGCALASVTVFLLFLTVPTFGRKLPHKQHKHGHLERNKELEESVQSGKNKDAPNYLNSHKEKESVIREDDRCVFEECHKAALHKCGQTFLRAHKLLTYLEDDLVAFRTRCGVRTAFFECMKTTREKICSRSSQYKHVFKVETDFRKKLTDALWATRVCVLGVKALKGL